MHHKCPEANPFNIADVFGFAFYSLIEHLTADKSKKGKRYIRDKLFKRGKILNNSMYAKPTDKWHRRLEKGENPRYQKYFSCFHARLVKSVCKGYRKGIHSKTESQQYTCDYKRKVYHLILRMFNNGIFSFWRQGKSP